LVEFSKLVKIGGFKILDDVVFGGNVAFYQNWWNFENSLIISIRKSLSSPRQRGLHFFSKKNEAKKTTPSKLTHSKFSKSVVYVI
jgi:hypothetical protein